MFLRLAAWALLWAGPPEVYAAFEEEGFSARAIAMGSAFTAVHDDLSSLPFNPAALGQLDNAQVGVNYLRPRNIPAGEVDLDQISLAAAIPIHQELVNGTLGCGWFYTDHEKYALDRSFHFSYGSRGLLDFTDSQLNIGASMKFLTRALKGGDSSLLPAFDWGFFYRTGERLSLGLSLLNINGPSVLGDRVPFTFKVGLADTVRNFVWAVDFTKREPSAVHRPSSSLGGGLEYWTSTARWGSFAVRTGLSLGDRLRSWNGGAGWRLFGSQFDYSVTVPMNDATPELSHAISMLFRFGASSPERQYEKLLKEEERLRQDLTGALEAGEIKRWKFEAEFDEQKRQVDGLRRQVEEKSSSERELKSKLREMQDRHLKAVDSYQKLKKEAERSPADKFALEWAAYERLKASGAAQSLLVERVRQLLRQYKDLGVDLSAANQELLRLLRGR